ncbi:hypothetical protein BD410DRAFT_787311 [Rickenella mellea]|uniref:Uncharacterized protein n=1 Tax=Rickenella mellea TaxID=50990 RepID=A0A4Y7Q753_9AGAM|nr:hypothetical protein BD410DRAFT_787311 [Rickenella mellea]
MQFQRKKVGANNEGVDELLSCCSDKSWSMRTLDLETPFIYVRSSGDQHALWRHNCDTWHSRGLIWTLTCNSHVVCQRRYMNCSILTDVPSWLLKFFRCELNCRGCRDRIIFSTAHFSPI